MTQSEGPIVGFIGLGAMGGPMASNVLKAGFALVVNDTRVEAAYKHLSAGAKWSDTPKGLAAQCDVIFSCLPNLAAIEAVALGEDGVLAGIAPGKAFFELSTNSPQLAARIHKEFAARGAHMLEAPISGGATGARRGRLAIWVGGEKSVYERYEPVLRAMGDQPLHVGSIGSGLVTKLVHNCTSQAINSAISEVFTLGVKAGADPLALWQAVRQGAVGRRRTFDGLVDQFLPGQYDDPHAALRIIHKDIMLATELGRSLDVPMRISELAFADIKEAMNRGWAERDCRCVMLLPQERVGLRIAVDPEKIKEVLQKDPPAPTDSKHGAGN